LVDRSAYHPGHRGPPLQSRGPQPRVVLRQPWLLLRRGAVVLVARPAPDHHPAPRGMDQGTL